MRRGVSVIVSAGVLAACKAGGTSAARDAAADAPSASAASSVAAQPPDGGAREGGAPMSQGEIVEAVMRQRSLQDAIRAASDLFPVGPPVVNAPGGGNGTVAVTAWAARHLVWTDVYVLENETAYAIAVKRPQRERGRRLCVSGKIMYLKPQTEGSDTFFHAMLQPKDGMLELMAVGSVGKLEGGSDARFCGAVTGDARYATKEGPAKALTLVGMFDVPDNRKDAGARQPAAAGEGPDAGR